jgi:hypothetical protein
MTEPLGSQGLRVTRLGLGAMGMTAFYGADPAAAEEGSLATLAKAVELSAPHPAFIDTGAQCRPRSPRAQAQLHWVMVARDAQRGSTRTLPAPPTRS